MPIMTDSMKKAKDICWYLWNMPEDYVESRISWSRLYEQLSDLRWGFKDAMTQLFADEENSNPEEI